MNLMLIFNGWGMDNSILKSLIIPDSYEVKVVDFPYDIKNLDFSNYNKIIYVGWSFGCYYLTKYILDNNISSDYIVALNGHGQTIGKFGIMPKMFDFTLNTLTPESLVKFYENMDIDSDFQFPQKDFEKVKDELQFFKDNYSPLGNIFKYAFVGENDKIIPSAKQLKYFNDNNVNTTILRCGHYPFKDKNLLLEIVKKVTNEL